MFYYAEINNDYLVINLYSLTESSTNPKYIAITEEQYVNGDLIGKYYNSLTSNFEVIDMDECMGSTDNVQLDTTNMILSTKLDNMQAEINNLANNNSDSVSQEDLQLLEDIIDTKANVNHSHSEYAPLSHSHDGLASEDYVDEKVDAITAESIGALPNTTVIPTVPTNVSAFVNDAGYLTEHQSLDGLATETYVNTQIDAIDIPNTLSDLTSDSTHRTVTDVEKATWNAKSNFSGNYNDLTNKPSIPSISGLATETYVDEAVNAKADSGHTHGDIYYTETEVNSLLATKSDSTHNHDTTYDALGSADSALNSAKAYADELIEDEVVNRNSAIATAKSSAISTAASDATTKANNALASAKTYADNAVSTVKNDLLNNAGSAYDTLKELGDLIDDNADAIEALETIASGKANASHTHTISNVTGLQTALDGKANASHGTHVSYSTTAPVMDGTASVGTASTVARSDHKHPTDTSRASQTSLDSHTGNKSNPHGVTLAQLGLTATAAELNILDGVTATTAEINYVDGVTSNIQTQLNAKASSSHTHGTATTSAAGLMSASDKSKLDGIASGANAYTLPTASSTLGGVKTTSTVTSNSGYTACPIIGGVPYYKDTNTTYNLGSFGVTATAAELNALDGITATVTELNYVDGVTSNIQTQLNGKAASSHTHNYAGSSSAGGAATSANKLATARTISLAGDVTGSTSFDGSGNVSITATVADDSHNHTIANVDGLQSALDGKSATSHTHTAEALVAMAEALFGTNYQGGVEYSYGSGSGKNVLTEISNMPQGFHTIYSIAGTTGNPETVESYRYFIHKTSTTIGWIYAFGADGSIYSNYLAGANTYKGWKTIHDAKRKPLWTGSYYMTAGHTATPSKKLSQCEHGWMLLWSDYDPDTSTVNNTDFCTTMIPNRNWAGDTWNGASYYCDIPRYSAGTATDSESRIIKILNVYDNKLVGNASNNAAPRNDVILRAVYEF